MMTLSGEFASGSWPDQLAEALASLATLHERFPDSLGEHVVHYRATASSSRFAAMAHHFEDALLALYYRACFDNGGEQEGCFDRLRSALMRALDILAAHPALADVADSSCSHRKFVVVIAGRGEETAYCTFWSTG